MRSLIFAMSAVSADLLAHPLFWALAFLVPFSVLFAVAHRLRWLQLYAAHEHNIMGAVAVLAIAGLLAISTTNLFSPMFIDVYEPTVAIGSALFARGEPLYQALDTEQRYSGAYGPYLYLFQ